MSDSYFRPGLARQYPQPTLLDSQWLIAVLNLLSVNNECQNNYCLIEEPISCWALSKGCVGVKIKISGYHPRTKRFVKNFNSSLVGMIV